MGLQADAEKSGCGLISAALVLRRLPTLGAALMALIAGSASALAHPHVFPLVKVTAVFDDKGRVIGAQEKWTFDYDYSAIFKVEADLWQG